MGTVTDRTAAIAETPQKWIDLFGSSFAFVPQTDGAADAERWAAYQKRLGDHVNALNQEITQWREKESRTSESIPRIYLVNAELYTSAAGQTTNLPAGPDLLLQTFLDGRKLQPQTSEQGFDADFLKNGFILFLGSLPTLTLRSDAGIRYSGAAEEDFTARENRNRTREQRAFAAVRGSELYIQAAISSGFGEYVVCDIEARLEADNARRESDRDVFKNLDDMVRHVIRHRPPCSIAERLTALYRDVETLYAVMTDLVDSEVVQAEEAKANAEIDWPEASAWRPPPAQTDTTGAETYRSPRILAPFLRQMAALWALGKGAHYETEQNARVVVPWLTLKLPTESRAYGGIYAVQKRIQQILGSEKHPSLAGQFSEELYQLGIIENRYEIYRDLARCLERGAGFWTEAIPNRRPADRQTAPLQILIIDDVLHVHETEDENQLGYAPVEEKKAFLHALSRISRVLRGRVDFYSIHTRTWFHIEQWLRPDAKKPPDSVLEKNFFRLDMSCFERGEEALVPVDLLEMTARFPKTGPPPKSGGPLAEFVYNGSRLTFFDFILMDIGFRQSFLGPPAVDRLCQALDEQTNRDDPSPCHVIVLTREDHIGYIHQCLNHGADAFLLKRRYLQLPARMANLRTPSRLLRSPGQAENFRRLSSLLPGTISQLKSEEPEHLIRDNHPSRGWVRSLPKADLHFHLGTSIQAMLSFDSFRA